MAETAYLGSRSNLRASTGALPGDMAAMHGRGQQQQRPQTSTGNRAETASLALSVPDRHAGIAAQVEAAKLSSSLREGMLGIRPQTAPANGLRLMGNNQRRFGLQSLYDRKEPNGVAHMVLGAFAPTLPHLIYACMHAAC